MKSWGKNASNPIWGPEKFILALEGGLNIPLVFQMKPLLLEGTRVCLLDGVNSLSEEWIHFWDAKDKLYQADKSTGQYKAQISVQL